MKVGFIAWERFGYGGVSRILSSLVNALSEQIEVKILCLKRETAFENVYHINTSRVAIDFMELTFVQKLRRELVNRLYAHTDFACYPKLLYAYPWLRFAHSYLSGITKWVNSNHFDIVVFGSGFEDCIQLAAIKPRVSTHTKLVAWSHASFKDYFRGESVKRDHSRQLLWQHYYKRFDAIVVLSDADVACCRDTLHLDACRIYNSNSFKACSRASLRGKRFLYVGALSYNKGSDLLIDAFCQFAQKNKDWTLDIYGDGPGMQYISQQIEMNHLEDRVKMHGYVNQVEAIYCQHDVLLFPSRYEGFGMVQIEAASCGLPVIASALPITTELIGKYGYGALFEWNDAGAMAELMLRFTEMDLSEMSEHGVLAARNFCIDEIKDQWLALFEKLLK